MANSMIGFFKEHAKPVETIKVVVSDRFTDPETGKVLEWELRPLTVPEEAEIRQNCFISTRDNKGRITQELDQNKYTLQSVVKSVVFPNLNDAELQRNYGVNGAERLLEVMLLSPENIRLTQAFNKLNKYDKSFDEVVEEAKD